MKMPSFVVGAIPYDDHDKNKIIIIDGKYIDWFRDLSKEEFYSLNNKQAKNCFWICQKSELPVFEGDAKKEIEYNFRRYFQTILMVMIEDSFEMYK